MLNRSGWCKEECEYKVIKETACHSLHSISGLQGTVKLRAYVLICSRQILRIVASGQNALSSRECSSKKGV